jgi:hypothetical protein
VITTLPPRTKLTAADFYGDVILKIVKRNATGPGKFASTTDIAREQHYPAPGSGINSMFKEILNPSNSSVAL